ncbi:MAG: response regulator [Hyphomicrobiaceae bacterium]
MTRPAALLDGASILLVEDEYLIALDIEQVLYDLGAVAVRTAACVSEALQQIASERPQLGILDVKLGNQSSTLVASELVRLSVPFVFVTGYSDSQFIDPAHHLVPVLDKPVDVADFRMAISMAMSQRPD